MYKTEENVTSNVVMVVPKLITREAEENPDSSNSPVTELEFTHCQTYVTLPGMREAAPPLPAICSGDTSYTRLPCSIFGIGIGKEEAVSSPPKDFLTVSSADSGFSFDDLTQSLDCSLTTSPSEKSPPLCKSTDYCILNKTADGFIPVFASNQINVQPDSLQED